MNSMGMVFVFLLIADVSMNHELQGSVTDRKSVRPSQLPSAIVSSLASRFNERSQSTLNSRNHRENW